ncbi:hypothetical protein AB0L85_27825 [Streptomyces sp. NPDC052051]|uniref:hypothetical protein n=1 Tax=Streptomyces sp. NPDC052051 TaxID=3154649 RepID=UPI00343FDC6C
MTDPDLTTDRIWRLHHGAQEIVRLTMTTAPSAGAAASGARYPAGPGDKALVAAWLAEWQEA